MRSWIAALLVLGTVHTAEATTYAKAIYVGGCRTIQGSAPIGLWGLWPTDAAAAPPWTPLVMTVVYCDAALPPNATAFDYVDLLYSWQPATPGDEGPTVAAFVDLQQEESDAVPYNQSVEIGECTANLATQGSENSICQTTGSMSFQGPGTLYPASVHFLIYFPPITDSTVSWAYRLFVYYEAP